MGKCLRRIFFACTLLALLFLCCLPAALLGNEIVQVRFKDDAALPAVTASGNKVVSVSFKDPQLTRIFSAYVIRSCVQSYPSVSEIPHSLSRGLSRVYEFELESGGLALFKQLDACIGFSITNKYFLLPATELVLPNDYHTDVVPCGAVGHPLKHLELIGAPAAWDITTGSPDIKIAVPDNGFNKNHEDLLGKIVNPHAITGFETHGTVVLGFAAANTNNGIGHSAIGYNCRLLVYEPGFRQFPQAILDGAKVINCSWYRSCTFNQNDQDMITIAHDMGIVVVAAAGNGGTCGGPTNYVYPAAYDHVIAVTGVGHYFPRGQRDVCNGKINHEDVHVYRAHGQAPHQTLQHNNKVDLAAPAYEVRGLSLSSYWNASGSSFASPIVAGVCGLLLSIYNSFTPDEVEGILKCTAFRLDDIPENRIYAGLLGAGRVDAYKALLKAKSMIKNKPDNILWYYYNRRGHRVNFEPELLYQHINAGSIISNMIFVEAAGKVPGINFDWEFKRGSCSIKKTGNPVSFSLNTDCSGKAEDLLVKVKNRVPVICDPAASISHTETAAINSPDIAILAVTLPPKPREAGHIVTPNPFRGAFYIRHSMPPVGLKSIQITNAAGQIVWAMNFGGTAPANIRVDLSRYANGTYFIKLIYANRVITERIVKRS